MKGRIGGDFHVTENRMVFVTLTKGGVSHEKARGCHTPAFLYPSHSSDLIPLIRRPFVPYRKNPGRR